MNLLVGPIRTHACTDGAHKPLCGRYCNAFVDHYLVYKNGAQQEVTCPRCLEKLARSKR